MTVNKAVAAVSFIFILASVALADDVMKSFAFQTIDGKTIEYRPIGGAPMVISIMSHW